MSLKFENLPPLVQEQFYDFVESITDGLLFCDRTWTAWEVGTMRDDDFALANDDYGFVSEKAEELWYFCVRMHASLLDGLRPPEVPQLEQELQVALDVLEDKESEQENVLWALSRLEDVGAITPLLFSPSVMSRRSRSGSWQYGFGLLWSRSRAAAGRKMWSSSNFDPVKASHSISSSYWYTLSARSYSSTCSLNPGRSPQR